MFELSLKRRAVRFLERADAKREAELMALLTALKENPVPFKAYDVSKLEGTKTSTGSGSEISGWCTGLCGVSGSSQ